MSAEPIIKVKSLSYTFAEADNSREVLKGIEMDVAPGEIVMVMGPSGSGKTTLLKILGGLRSLQKGTVLVEEVDLAKASPKELAQLRRRIGFIFQDHHLLPQLTAIENVLVPILAQGPASGLPSTSGSKHSSRCSLRCSRWSPRSRPSSSLIRDSHRCVHRLA